ncbi:MAG: VTT domain-containing protein [Anaerolineaceae bacterium]|jgi:uncharacterized membrane protein YdjX (TVP38/TMEM64 family)|nr:VTT domain-containing protein [Anaerolineaceae bacterium]MDD4042304.1 VTT domain-containing protein [Anaerolineaceae bacterium]MDD4578289.1 VTT domain-containing protein [Anaerolineaceae bacterium]
MVNSLEGKPQFTRGQKIWRVVLLVAVMALSIVLIIYRDQIQHLEAYGYPGIFLLSILSNATVLIPLPGVVFTSAMGAVFDPFLVAIASGTGAALGELSGYMVGVGGQVWLSNRDWYHRLEKWIKKYNHWPIILLAFIPNPLFDMAGFIAGAGKVPLWKFLLFTWIGKIAKMLLFAYLGAGIFKNF